MKISGVIIKIITGPRELECLGIQNAVYNFVKDLLLHDWLYGALDRAANIAQSNVSETLKKISIKQLEASLRIKNLVNRIGVNSVWDLVNISEDQIFKSRNFMTRPRMSKLVGIIDEACKVLSNKG